MERLFVLIFAGLLLAFIIWLWRNLKTMTVYDYQCGLMYRDGKFVRQVEAGRHWSFLDRMRIVTFDKRELPLLLSGQEILTKDHVHLKLTLVGTYRIADAAKAQNETTDYLSSLYVAAQLALRECVCQLTVDGLLEARDELDEKIAARVGEAAAKIGIEVKSAAIRDILLPANLKKAYSGVLEAQKTALVELEKARGEQAVLRSLANSSKLYSENPSLLQARVIQSLASGGNSIVFGADSAVSAKPVTSKK